MMWQKPWGYKEGFAICSGLFCIGTIWQILLGRCSFSILAYPVNVIVGIGYLITLLLIYFLFRKTYLIRWMTSYPATVSSMVSVVVLILFMGLIRQLRSDVELTGIESWLGFSQMLSACSFILLFFWMTTLLGLTTLRRLHCFCWRDIPFYLNHLGLFIALLGAVLGSADMQRMEITAQVGRPEWRAMNEQKQLVELPIAIELLSFKIDEYPPKLMVIDNASGKALPLGKPENLLVEKDTSAGELLDWRLVVETNFPMAASVATTDTVNFVEFYSMGAAPALYVKAVHIRTGEQHQGWVSCGSFMFPYKALRLNEQQSLVMPELEPKRFASEVNIYTESGKKEKTVIEVNQPFEIEGWKIYQLSYDETKGRWSDISVFELVRDPWLPVVYTGVWMMIAGAVCLFTLAQRRKEESA